MDERIVNWLNNSDFEFDTDESEDEVDDSDIDPDYFPNQQPNEEQNTWNCDNDGIENDVDENIQLIAYEFEDNVNMPSNEITWGPVTGNLNTITYNPLNLDVGINPDIIDCMEDCAPIDFYALFFDENVLDFLISETNRYAHQIINSRRLSKCSRLKKWTPIDRTEMRNFLGLIVWMGLVNMPNLRDYWRTDFLYKTRVPEVMSRNRFELILGMCHCGNNEMIEYGRLNKVQHLVDMLVANFNKWYIPEDKVCIDESVVPFIGRLVFRQYLKNKKHRYGIKIFKLCSKDFYALRYNIYAGKEVIRETDVSYKIVLKLMEPYLNFGRTLYTDNWYSSVKLAEKLNQENTHLVGTLRPISNNNVVILKWRDKRDILLITTKHSDQIIEIQKRDTIIKKPLVVEDYNIGKSYIDRSDQMSSYSSPLKKTIKWYKKVAFDILLSTATVNALSLFKSVTKNKSITITTFKEEIIKQLLYKPNVPRPISPGLKHLLVTTQKKRMCKPCYAQKSENLGRLEAQNKTRKVFTHCEGYKPTEFDENHFEKSNERSIDPTFFGNR
ncbi:piggyBac transposable element-derived protein 2-like [Sipha flava]|uniref:PiggyBac transposable element-derived protein 2-like n=1 Tax=Sipha flava TaxID=143950 RepID=A0A8B8FAP3_9HEMI|nr:piggyBac transposable element-derived protein 2-like [Sipha flava]